MTFQIDKQGHNIYVSVRRAGYRPLRHAERGEMNFVRPLGGDYPRFHLYIKETENAIIFNLHLDQKKPVYEGVAAHSGDYDSEVVRDEAARIQELISQ